MSAINPVKLGFFCIIIQMTEGEKLTKFESFCREIETEKEQARLWSWFILVEASKGTEIGKIQMEAVKEILDRLEGKAKQTQIISGEAGLPVLVKIIRDEGETNKITPEAMGSI